MGVIAKFAPSDDFKQFRQIFSAKVIDGRTIFDLSNGLVPLFRFAQLNGRCQSEGNGL